MFWIILLNWGKCILHHHFMVIIWNPQDPSHVLQYLVEFYCLHIGSCETFWKDSCALYFKPNPQKWGFTRFQWGQTRWIKLPHLCSAVEIKKKTALCLRVTYAFRLFQSGGNEKLMRELTGHVSNDCSSMKRSAKIKLNVFLKFWVRIKEVLVTQNKKWM